MTKFIFFLIFFVKFQTLAQMFHPVKFPNCVNNSIVVSATATTIAGISTSATPVFSIPYGCTKARVLMWGAGGGSGGSGSGTNSLGGAGGGGGFLEFTMDVVGGHTFNAFLGAGGGGGGYNAAGAAGAGGGGGGLSIVFYSGLSLVTPIGVAGGGAGGGGGDNTNNRSGGSGGVAGTWVSTLGAELNGANGVNGLFTNGAVITSATAGRGGSTTNGGARGVESTQQFPPIDGSAYTSSPSGGNGGAQNVSNLNISVSGTVGTSGGSNTGGGGQGGRGGGASSRGGGGAGGGGFFGGGGGSAAWAADISGSGGGGGSTQIIFPVPNTFNVSGVTGAVGSGRNPGNSVTLPAVRILNVATGAAAPAAAANAGTAGGPGMIYIIFTR